MDMEAISAALHGGPVPPGYVRIRPRGDYYIQQAPYSGSRATILFGPGSQVEAAPDLEAKMSRQLHIRDLNGDTVRFFRIAAPLGTDRAVAMVSVHDRNAPEGRRTAYLTRADLYALAEWAITTARETERSQDG